MAPTNGGANAAPIDRAVLERIRSRFIGSQLFASAAIVEDGKLHLHVDVSGDYYPPEVSAHFIIRWYRNDDFTIHYQEEHKDGTWMCQWGRHPNAHNTRDNFHPPPNAGRTDAENAQWPPDHRDVCRLVLDHLEERIETLWDRQ